MDRVIGDPRFHFFVCFIYILKITQNVYNDILKSNKMFISRKQEKGLSSYWEKNNRPTQVSFQYLLEIEKSVNWQMSSLSSAVLQRLAAPFSLNVFFGLSKELWQKKNTGSGLLTLANTLTLRYSERQWRPQYCHQEFLQIWAVCKKKKL